MTTVEEQTKIDLFEAKAEERRKCVREIENFSREYVDKWLSTQGESAKAEGWAILQAAEHIRYGRSA